VIGDGERIADLRAAATRALEGARGASQLLAERAGDTVDWATWIGDPARLAVVGTLDGHVVGYGLAWLARRGPVGQEDLTGVVHEVWVEPEARGVGVGEAVMATVTEWCIQAGCRGIDGVALPGDRVMKGFFERHGLTARLLVMHRRLPGPGGGV
jgi:GNAT superfamily N-acetyltransferase